MSSLIPRPYRQHRCLEVPKSRKGFHTTEGMLAAIPLGGLIEFGPIWLVALAVPALLYGPHWAGLTAALGVGGLLGLQPWLTRR